MLRQKTIRVTLLPSSELESIQQEALEFAGIGLYRYRFDGTILFMDRGAFRIFNLESKFPDPVSVIGRNISELFVYTGSRELLLKEIRERTHVRGFEHRFKTLSGIDKVVLNDSYLVKDPKTGQEVIQVIMFDITERRRTEEQLRQVLTSARCILWHSTVTEHDNGTFEWLINVSNEDAAEQLLPLKRHPGQKYSDVWHERITPEDRARMDRTSTEAMRGDLPGYSQEFRCTRSDGQIRWLSEETHIQRLNPHHWFVVGVCTDITERKRIEEALRKSEARYRAVVEDQPDLICRFNPDTLLTFVNESYCRYYGKRRDELIGHSFMPLVPLDQRENVKRAFSSLTQDHPFVTYAFPTTMPDGRVRWQQWTDRAVFDEQGRFIEYQSSGVDVTEQKEAEHRHRAFSSGLRAVVAIADELISCPDLDSLFKRAVERSREKLGLERCGIFIREGPDLRGTYGTNLKGHTTDEHPHHFPTQTDWLERIQALRPQDRRMIVIEQPYVEFRDATATEHDKGWIAITPIQSATDFIGVFSNDTAITREPMDETKQEIISVFCSLLGAIIERKRMESRQRKVSEGLRAVVEIADELISCPDLDTICRRTVELAREKLDLNRCAIFLRDGDVLRGTYGTNLQRQTTNEHDHVVDPYPDWLKHFQALRPEERQMIIHEEPYTEWAGDKVVRFDKGWVALTPIQSAESFVGMFSNDTAIARTPVDEAQQEIVTVLCSLLGAIIERKRAEDRLRKAHDDLEVRVRERTAELTRVNEHLREVQSRQRAILNNIPDIAWLKDREGRFIAANEPFAKACGIAPEQLVGKTDLDIWPKELATRYHTDDEEVMRSRKSKRFEEPIATKDGTMSWIETIKTPVFNERDEVIGTTGIARDITERKKVEEILRRSHEELEKLVRERTRELEDANVTLKKEITGRKRIEEDIRQLAMVVEQEAEAVVISDTKGQIQYVNPAFEKMTGYPRDTVIGHNPRFLKSGKQDSQYYARMWETLSHGEVWSGHLSNKRKDGTLYDVEAVISPIRDDKGQIVNYVATTRDVTREMQLEEQFRQAQKMEAIGRLAGGIAHDFNNLLTSILGYSRLVTDELEDGNPIKSDMEEIIHAGERAAALTKQLLAFSRKQMIQLQPINLNAVVLDMDKLLRRTLGEDIELVTLIDNEMGCINADAGLIEQAVMNLAVNARDAMPKGGSLTIQTATVHLDEKQCRGRINVEPGDYVMVSVRDTGMGMSNEVKDHCLEPFFTTKEKGKGTGLGLSIVYSIVKQFGGFIDIETSPKTGTDIRMYLPAVEAAACEMVARERVALPRGNETILVVEDEETVRRLAVRILESLGYQVLQARHGGEALLICERFDKPIQLVLSDVVMPHLGGQELVERLRKIRQDFKVLFMSGFTDESFVRNAKAGQEVALLLKPFTQETLAVRVRQILDRRDAQG
jgi:PAS domain S-box-containing protein